MKFKTVVATALVIVVTGPVFAKIGTVLETANGGEMALSLFSQSAAVSYQLDSGILFNDFKLNALRDTIPGIGTEMPYTWATTLDTSTDVAFASFMALAGSAADLSFSFMGGDNKGVTFAARSMVTTVRDGAHVDSVLDGNIVDGNNHLYNYINAVNAKHSSGMETNGSSFFTEAEGAGHYFGGTDKSVLGGKFPIGNDGLVGIALDVYLFDRTTTSYNSHSRPTRLGTFSVSKLNDAQYSVEFLTPYAIYDSWGDPLYGTPDPLTPIPSVPEPTGMVLALLGLFALSARNFIKMVRSDYETTPCIGMGCHLKTKQSRLFSQ